MIVASTSVPVLTVIARFELGGDRLEQLALQALAIRARRKRTKAVRSGVASRARVS